MHKKKHIAALSFCIIFLMTGCGSAENPVTGALKSTIMHGATMGADKNFKFYGKVVDDNGQPVPGAVMKLGVGHYDPFAEYLKSTKKVEKMTDAQGLFELSAKGSNIFIKDIVKAGYEYSRQNNSENNSFNFNRRLVGEEDIKFEKTDPIVYHVRKRGEVAYMYKKSFGWNFKSMDNKSVKFAILNSWVDDDGFGHGYENKRRGTKRYPKIIDMSCVFSEDLLRYEIKFEYLGENGGIVSNDQVLYEAPVEGYTKSVTLKGDMIDHWNESGDRRTPAGKNQESAYLYVKADGGSYYSRIELKIDTRPDRGNLPEPYCCVSLGCKVFTNPEGTLSLEYDQALNAKENMHRNKVGKRRSKAMREASVNKQTFDEKAFIKQIREEEKAEKENQAKQQDKQQSNSKKKFLGLF